MGKVLLISETDIKNMTNISDNINGKLLNPSIVEAQEVGLRQILGDTLLDKLKTLIEENVINDVSNIDYKNLLIKSQYYLVYRTMSEVIVFTSVKIDNAGLEQVSDDKMQPITIEDTFQLRDYYLHKADYYCTLLQNYLLQNRNKYPELTQWHLHSVHSNLLSSASCNIFLGGKRGYKPYKRCYNLRKKYGD